MHCRSENSQTRRWTLMEQPSNHSQRRVILIDILPDNILLIIFDFYSPAYPLFGDNFKRETEKWQFLVHVCRRWRSLVLAESRRLNLQLVCTADTPARDTLDVWPALPLDIKGNMTPSGTDNVIAALCQSNRVRQVILRNLEGWQMERVLAAMQVPFPELTYLELLSHDETPPLIPDSFMDGSAPLLRHFELRGIPFPGLPRLLLSAPHLVQLHLFDIPHSGYTSPEAIVDLLSVLFSLQKFSLRFRSPQSRPDPESRRPPPPKRSVMPALTSLRFTGVTEYLEDLVTFIDTPRLGRMDITFFNQIDFDTPRLAQFINRTLKLTKPDAYVRFNDDDAHVVLRRKSDTLAVVIVISCREPDWQLSSTEQVCNSLLLPLSTVEDLYIDHRYHQLIWKDDPIENTLWLRLLLPFTAVKNLNISEQFSQGIAAALKELAGQNNGSVAQPAEDFRGGAWDIGTFSRNH